MKKRYEVLVNGDGKEILDILQEQGHKVPPSLYFAIKSSGERYIYFGGENPYVTYLDNPMSLHDEYGHEYAQIDFWDFYTKPVGGKPIVGKPCVFWNNDPEVKYVGIYAGYDDELHYRHRMLSYSDGDTSGYRNAELISDDEYQAIIDTAIRSLS